MLFDDETDTDLLILLAEGDRMAMAELYDRYAPPLYSLAQAILGPSIEAEEILHEIFLEAWKRAPIWHVAQRRSMGTWLFTRLRQRCLEERQISFEQCSLQAPPTLLPTDWQHRGRYDVAAIDDPHFGRARSRLHQLLSDLSAQTRQCLELSLFEGLSLSELAARTGQKTQSVLGHLALAHDHVSEGLRTEWST